MLIEFELPHDQSAVLGCLSEGHRLRDVPKPSMTWTGNRAIQPGDRAPVLRQGSGTVLVTDAVWGRLDVHSGERMTQLNPAGVQSAWPCLIPMSAYSWEAAHTDGAHGDDGRRLAPVDEDEWFLAAGFWRPADQRNAESFVALTRATANSGRGKELIVVPPAYWLAWLDPQNDNHWLYDLPVPVSLKVQASSPALHGIEHRN